MVKICNPFIMLVLHLLLLVAYGVCQRSELKTIYPTYENHECNRKCDGQTKTCYYKLTLDRFFTMQPDCLNCRRYNQSDCDNPQCIPGDGAQRQVLVFNGLLPGPSIAICHGDNVEVDVVNLVDPETTTVHWHGMHMRNNSWNDGAPITQCPILPGTTWRYSFKATQPGTHFYHSHSSMQRSDGAYGHLIVREASVPNKKYKYDYDLTEHVISFLEWLTYMAIDDLFRFYRIKVFYTDRQTAILVNGYGPNTTNNSPIKTFVVQKGKSYRFRVIHAGSLPCPLEMSVDGHQMKIISSDGEYIQPETVDVLGLNNGERYDFILDANQKVTSYGIRIYGTSTCSNLQTLAILTYDSNSNNSIIRFDDRPPLSGRIMNCGNVENTPNCINYNQMSSIKPLENELRKADFKYYISFDAYNEVLPRFDGVLANEFIVGPYVNSIMYSPPSTPLLIDPNATEFCNQEHKINCNAAEFCQCSHVVPIPAKNVVELIFINEGKMLNMSHPFHLHGYIFRVIGQEKLGAYVSSSTVRELDSQGKLVRNFTNPILKDTVSVPDGGYAIVRFKADNPGFWMLHCHVDFHSEAGMMMAIAVSPYPKVPRNFPRCGNYGGSPHV